MDLFFPDTSALRYIDALPFLNLNLTTSLQTNEIHNYDPLKKSYEYTTLGYNLHVQVQRASDTACFPCMLQKIVFHIVTEI